jgi:soluble cytochrome b562
MSIAGIASSSLSQLANIQRNYQQVRGEFKQMGQDLQTGNLAQAQTDFVTLSQSAASQFGSNSPVTKTLNTIGQALQSGNLATARQAFSSLPVGMVGACAEPHHSKVGSTQNPFGQALNQLGQALQSGNLSAAQQAFAAMQQTWQQVAPNAMPVPSAGGLTTGASSVGINVTV